MNNAAAFLVDSSGHPIYKHKTFVQVGMTSGLEGKWTKSVNGWRMKGIQDVVPALGLRLKVHNAL